MKILKQFEARSDESQLLSWLRWLKYNCTGTLCKDRRFYTGSDNPSSACRIRSIYREVIPTGRISSPVFWVLPKDYNFPDEPDNLDFLYKIKWDNKGNPIPELKEEF